LAIAVESVIKLIAFVAVGIYALGKYSGPRETLFQAPLLELAQQGLPPGFAAQTALAFAAMFCLPRQYQVAIVECEDPRDLRRARWLLPLYLLLISLLVLPILGA